MKRVLFIVWIQIYVSMFLETFQCILIIMYSKVTFPKILIKSKCSYIYSYLILNVEMSIEWPVSNFEHNACLRWKWYKPHISIWVLKFCEKNMAFEVIILKFIFIHLIWLLSFSIYNSLNSPWQYSYWWSCYGLYFFIWFIFLYSFDLI